MTLDVVKSELKQQHEDEEGTKKNQIFNYNDDEDEVPEEVPHNIIESTLYKFSQ